MPDVDEPTEQDCEAVALAARLRVVVGQTRVSEADEVTVEVKLTAPTKLKRLVTVTFRETPVCPMFRLAGVVVIWKSPT